MKTRMKTGTAPDPIHSTRYPYADAWATFRSTHPQTFDGEARGPYLANRLQEAFTAGWNAAQRAIDEALGRR